MSAVHLLLESDLVSMIRLEYVALNRSGQAGEPSGVNLTIFITEMATYEDIEGFLWYNSWKNVMNRCLFP